MLSRKWIGLRSSKQANLRDVSGGTYSGLTVCAQKPSFI
jgi:hypothetical protein